MVAKQAQATGTGKKAMNVRLSTQARQILDSLAAAKGISRTAVLELAVRDFAEAEAKRPQAQGPD